MILYVTWMSTIENKLELMYNKQQVVYFIICLYYVGQFLVTE
jgi:hypothetical protein